MDGIYIYLIVSFLNFGLSSGIMFFRFDQPPKKYSSWIYSSSKFAKFINNLILKIKFIEPHKTNLFDLVAFYVSATNFIISLIILIIDLSSHHFLCQLIGNSNFSFISGALFISTLLYEDFLVFWWHCLASPFSRKEKKELRKADRIALSIVIKSEKKNKNSKKLKKK